MNVKTRCPICQQEVIWVLTPQYRYCEECRLAVRTMESRLSVEQVGQVFNASWALTHFKGKWNHRKAGEILKLAKSLYGVRRILDIGCGSGILVDMLARAGYRSTGLDNSDGVIWFAKAHGRGDYVLAENGTALGAYDLVVMSHLLEHLDDPVGFLEQSSSLLKPEGYLYIAVLNLNFYNDNSLWRRHVDRTLFAGTHITGISEHSLRLMLAKAGYKIIWIKTQTKDTTLLDKLALHLLRLNNKYAVPGGGKMRSVYESIAFSPVFKLLLHIPNELISRHGRGVELVALASKE